MQFQIEGTTLVKYDFDHQEEIAVVPDGVEVIGKYAFYVRDKVKQVIIPSTVREIGDFTFRRCDSLEHLELPEGLKKVGYNAFEECYSLKTVRVGGTEYRIRDRKAPESVRLVCESMEKTRRRMEKAADSSSAREDSNA